MSQSQTMQSLLATYVLDGAGSGSTNDATVTPYNGGGSEEQMSAFTAIAELIVDRDAGDCEDNAACMKVDDSNENCADKSSSSYSLQDLIELMEPYLTSSVEQQRYRATMLLAELLHHKQHQLQLSSAVLHLFIVFFNHRIADFPSIVPSLHALTAIIKFHGERLDVRYGDLFDIFQTTAVRIHVPSYAQNVRYKVWSLYSCILNFLNGTHSDTAAAAAQSAALQPSGALVLEGLICCVDEEKDPRCLLLAFQVLKQAIDHFPDSLLPDTSARLGLPVAAQLFESTSAYFPITFSPPPNDPFGITPDALIDALQAVMCAHRSVANVYSVGFLVTQLHQDQKAARLQSLQMLQFIAVRHTHTGLYFDKQQQDSVLEQRRLQRKQRQRGHGDGDDGDDDDDDVDVDNELLFRDEHPLDSTAARSATATATATAVVASAALAVAMDRSEEMLQRQRCKTLAQLAEILSELAMEETEAELIAAAFKLVGAISNSIGKDLMGIYRIDWDEFNGLMLKKITAELNSSSSSSSGNSYTVLGGLRAKAAFDLSLVMCRLGGPICAGAVANVMLPQLLPHVRAACTATQQQVVRQLGAKALGISRISTLTAQSEEVKTLPAALDMLTQLIASLGSSSGRSSYSRGGLGSSQTTNSSVVATSSSAAAAAIDCSNLRELDALKAFAIEIFEVVATLFLDLSAAVAEADQKTDATGAAAAASAAAAAVAVNPFETLRRNLIMAGDSTTGSGSNQSTSSSLAAAATAAATAASAAGVEIDSGVMVALGNSMRLMTELLKRMDANQLQQIDATLSKYVSAVLGAAVTGLPSALGSTVPQVQLADSCSEVVRLQGLQLLVSLALVKPAAWIEIQCVTAIMSCIEKADHAYATAVNAGDDETAADNPLAAIKCALEYQRRRYRLLTAIVSQLEVSPVFDSLMAHLQQQFQSDTDALLAVSGSDSSSAADADRVAFILQHMQMLISTARDLIQRVKGVEDAQDTQVRGNESKVLRLLQCNGAAKGSQRNTSPLMQLLEGTMRLTEKVVAFSSSSAAPHCSSLIIDTLAMNIYIAYDAVARVSNALSAAPAADASAAATHEALQAHVAQLLASWLRQSLAAEQWFTARVTVSYATMFYRHINKSAAVWTAAADGGDGASPQPKLILLQLLEDTVLLLLRHNPTSPAAPSSLSTGSKLINKKIGDKMVYSLNEWGPAQLIAIIINKAPAEGSILGSALAMVAESCLGSASVQESFEARAAAVAWTAAALMRRKTITFNPQASGSLQMQALLAPVATAAGNVKACTSWQDYYSELILSCFCMSAKSKSDQFAWRLACNVPVLFAAHSLFECSSTCSGSSAAREADNSAREAPFWRQKTWSKLSGPILQSALIKIRSLADSDNTNDDLTPLLATCALTASAASLKSIDSSTLADLTVVVVYSISRSRAHQGEHSEQMLALMRVSFDALEHLLKNNVEQFEPHLNIIVPALLQTAEAGSTGRARVTALEGLLSITEYVAYPKLHPYRKQVEQSTLRMLDDRKRAVRYLAGTLRNKWMLLMK